MFRQTDIKHTNQDSVTLTRCRKKGNDVTKSEEETGRTNPT
jgi:hypothetical protein